MKANPKILLLVCILCTALVNAEPSEDLQKITNAAWAHILKLFTEFLTDLNFTACNFEPAVNTEQGNNDFTKGLTPLKLTAEPLKFALKCEHTKTRLSITDITVSFKEIDHPMDSAKKLGMVAFGFSHKCQRARLEFTETLPVTLSKAIEQHIRHSLLIYFKALDGLAHTIEDIQIDLLELVEQLNVQRINPPSEIGKSKAPGSTDTTVKTDPSDIIDSVIPLIDLFKIEAKELVVFKVSRQITTNKDDEKNGVITFVDDENFKSPKGQGLKINIDAELTAFSELIDPNGQLQDNFKIQAIFCTGLPQRPEHAFMGKTELLIIFSSEAEKVLLVAKSSFFRIDSSVSAPLRNFILFSVQQMFEKVGTEIFDVVQHLKRSRLYHHNIMNEATALLGLIASYKETTEREPLFVLKNGPSNAELKWPTKYERLAFGETIDFLLWQDAGVLFFALCFKSGIPPTTSQFDPKPTSLVFYFALPSSSQYNLLFFLQTYVFELLEQLDPEFDVSIIDHESLITVTRESYFKPTKRRFFMDMDRWIICDSIKLGHEKIKFESSIYQFIVEPIWSINPPKIVDEITVVYEESKTEENMRRKLSDGAPVTDLRRNRPLFRREGLI